MSEEEQQGGGRTRTARRPRRVRAEDRRPTEPVFRRGRWILLLMMTVVTVLVLAAYVTPVLGVRSVKVNGAVSVPEQQLVDAAGVPLGTPMLQVNVDEVRSRLRAVPEIRSAQVSLSWPSAVQLDVVERQPAVFVLSSNGVQLLDVSGVAFKTVGQPPEGLPELRVRSATAADEITHSAMSVLAALPPALRGDVTTVVAESPYDIRILLKGQREVQWGDAGDIARKAAILPPLLTRPGHVYDISTPELVAVS